MIAELGLFCLILALLCAGVQACGLFRAFTPAVRAATFTQFGLITISFAALLWCYIVTDLSVANVVANSHSLKPLLYRIAGTWGNHEGSMLLWVLMLALFGALVAARADNPFITKVLSVQGMLGLGFIAFSLFTSNPFERVLMPPVDGNGLNPVLQDPALAIHPPFLYAGYVGFSVVFSFAAAALLERRMDREIAAAMRPWVMLAWTCLSAGIALGSFWAYYELGWGGFWFWDPVENASLMPWLVGTALIHSVIVTQNRGALPRWTLLLAILTFSLSLLGTFLVRSGVLTSVHAFAVDPDRGLFILFLLFLYTGGALLLYGLRAGSFAANDTPFSPVSREGTLVLNNLFLSVIAATVLIGTLYPLILNALGLAQISVGPPYFHATVLPLCIPLLALMGAAFFVPWKNGNMRDIARRLTPALLTTAFIMLIVAGLNKPHLLPSLACLGLAAWVMCGTALDFYGRVKLYRLRIPLGQWGMMLAHIGLGVAIAGMMGSTLWVKERAEVLKPGDRIEIADTMLVFRGVEAVFGPNYTSAAAQIDAFKIGASEPYATLTPEKRHYPVAAQNTTEAAIHTTLANDIYTVLGEQDGDGWVIRAWAHPLIALLWLGYLLITLGGTLSLIARIRCKNE